MSDNKEIPELGSYEAERAMNAYRRRDTYHDRRSTWREILREDRTGTAEAPTVWPMGAFQPLLDGRADPEARAELAHRLAIKLVSVEMATGPSILRPEEALHEDLCLWSGPTHFGPKAASVATDLGLMENVCSGVTPYAISELRTAMRLSLKLVEEYPHRIEGYFDPRSHDAIRTTHGLYSSSGHQDAVQRLGLYDQDILYRPIESEQRLTDVYGDKETRSVVNSIDLGTIPFFVRPNVSEGHFRKSEVKATITWSTSIELVKSRPVSLARSDEIDDDDEIP